MRTEPGSTGWTPTLVALAATVAIGIAGCDRSAPPGAETTTSTETPPPAAPPVTPPPVTPPATPPSIKQVRFPPNYFYTDLPEGFREMEMQAPPKFSFSRWVGGTEAQIAELERLIGPRGDFRPCLHEKLVIVQYWTTAAAPGLRSITRNNDLLERFADEDVVFVAIHPNVKEWGVDTMDSALETHGAAYPSAVDAEDRSTEMDWRFNVVPGYVLIDPHGIVRAAGLRASVVPEAVDMLLEEWALIKASGRDDTAAD